MRATSTNPDSSLLSRKYTPSSADHLAIIDQRPVQSVQPG